MAEFEGEVVLMKEKILYIHPGRSSFVEKDIAILNSAYNVRIHAFDLGSKIKLAASFVREFFFLLFNMHGSKKWIVQFAGYQSFLPVLLGTLFRKKVVIVLGGTDCVSFPSIHYGCFYNKTLKPFTAYSLKNASLLLPVDQSLVLYDYTYTDSDFNKQGYLFHAPNVRTPYKVVFNGYTSDSWLPVDKSPGTFVTVAADLGTRFGPSLKGIDLIIGAAKEFPECTFYIVGGAKLNIEVPVNVKLMGNIPNYELPKFIGSMEFYLQLSMSEGFPNALCEAMLAGCIPIVSNVGAMPMIVDGCGFILKRKDPAELAELLRTALKSPEKAQLSNLSRARIKDNFPLERRQNELLGALNL